MEIGDFKARLLEKERELLADIALFETEAREAGGEPGDPLDEAKTAEIQATSLGESSIEWQTLTAVRDALRRIDDNSFGVCAGCGRPIEPARLEAIPWTPYCRKDQEKRDASVS